MPRHRKHEHRFQMLLDVLRPCRLGATARALADEIECNLRSVQRDLAALVERGWVEVSTPASDGRGGPAVPRYVLTSLAKQYRPFEGDPMSLFAVRLGLQTAASVLADSEVRAALDELVRRVEAAMPPAERLKARTLDAALPVRPVPGRVAAFPLETLADVLEATVRRLVLRATYRPAWHGRRAAERSYDLHPVVVLPYRGVLYLLARIAGRDKLLRFAVHRFEHVEILRDRTFELPPDLDVAAELAATFGIHDGEPLEVRLRFDPVVAGAVRERIWSDGQTLTDRPDGGVDLAFRAAGRPEIRGWILSYGALVEVLAPDDLRREVAEELRRAASLYRR